MRREISEMKCHVATWAGMLNGFNKTWYKNTKSAGNFLKVHYFDRNIDFNGPIVHQRKRHRLNAGTKDAATFRFAVNIAFEQNDCSS
jgi:hypothetical protein